MFKPISRRTLLRGAGAALGLPWLEVMSHASPSTDPLRLSEPPLRAAFLFWSNGVRPDHWTPAGDGEDYEITPHLKPLESLKNDFLLLENLWNKNTIGRNGHWPKVPVWLSGGYVQRTMGDDLDTGAVSVDQLAAQKIGDDFAARSNWASMRRAPASTRRAAGSRACTGRLSPGAIRRRRSRRRSSRNWPSTGCSAAIGRRWCRA